MGYYIHTVARTAGVYDDIVVKLPIVIDPKVISIHWLLVNNSIKINNYSLNIVGKRSCS